VAAVEVVAAAVERLSPEVAVAAAGTLSPEVAEAAAETLSPEVAQEAVEIPKLELAEVAATTLPAAGVAVPRTPAMHSMAATRAPRQSIPWPVARPPPVTRPPSPGCGRGVVRLRLRP